MMRLRIRAPFAAFRSLTAGSFRPSAPFLTPATVYGLLLNLAGIESRLDDGKSVTTGTQADLPNVEIALGIIQWPEEQTIFQQLHNYPVGSSGKERQESCKGNKYNIQPIRRAFLSGVEALVLIRGNDDLIEAIRQNLTRDVSATLRNGQLRYGIPFLGDNNFMVDLLKEEPEPLSVPWLMPADLQDEEREEVPKLYRLPTWIDRQEMAKTQSALFEKSPDKSEYPPEQAWVRVGPPTPSLVAI